MPQVVRVIDAIRQGDRFAVDLGVADLGQQVMDAVEARLLLVDCLDDPPGASGMWVRSSMVSLALVYSPSDGGIPCPSGSASTV